MTDPSPNLEHHTLDSLFCMLTHINEWFNPLGGSNVQLYLPFCLLTVCLSHCLPRGR